jgi:hypothetical protein
MVNGTLIFSFALAQFSSEVVKLVDTSTPQGAGVCRGGGSVIYDCASVGGRNFVGKRFFFDVGLGVFSCQNILSP